MARNFLRHTGVALSALGLLALGGPAWADAASEAFVASNAQPALATLSQKGLTPAAREAKFSQLMQNFTDFPRISDFVLGRYARAARADTALYAEWQETFRTYVVTVYEDQFDEYTGKAIRVLPGSQDSTINGKLYSVVHTEVVKPTGQTMLVDWRLLQTNGAWKVVDVGIKLDQNLLWLGIQQRQDFLSFLDQHNGDVRALIAEVKSNTGKMRSQINGKGT
jgi:phospholipid transport system substrate-binding protein